MGTNHRPRRGVRRRLLGDHRGRRSIPDFTAGIAVASTGHCHPTVVAAIQAQAAKFIHAQVNCYRHDLLGRLAARLVQVTPPSIEQFFFSNSGAEATEASVKLAKHATGRPNVIVFAGSFHGRTHLTMAMTTSRTKYRAGHQPLPAGIFVAPFPNLAAARGDENEEVDRCLAGLRQLLVSQTAPEETAAMVIEPVQGEGGYTPAPARFLRGVADICAQHGILFIADEVQSGFGRTGRLFAVEHYGIEPDIMLMAKGIASGMPLSAVGARADLMQRWPTGSHGGTYGGNPVACAAALATLEVLTEDGFLEHVRARGQQLRDGLTAIAGDHPQIVDVRGLGLMIGCQFDEPALVSRILRACLEDQLILTNAGTYGDTIRWMPPLVVSESEIAQGLDIFGKAISRSL